MASKISAHRAPGTRDFLPDEMALRERVRRVIEETFRLYGFQPLETPATERLDVLTGKYGEEADRLIFKILKRGDELEAAKAAGDLADLGLRYDLTVPLARVVAMHRGELIYPFKRYQIQPVWRAERQQKGRYREFVQCDVDIVGTSSVSADAEIIALINDVLQRLEIPGYRIHVNHRMLLQGIVEYCGAPKDHFIGIAVAIDKLDKIGWDGVTEELIRRQIGTDVIDKIRAIIDHSFSTPREFLDGLDANLRAHPAARRGIEELNQIFGDLHACGIPAERISLTPRLARGLDYYTGPIFETLIEEPKIGSITGGGRYDNLIGVFSGETIPATGTSFGIERIFDVMRELRLFGDAAAPSARVLVAVFSEEMRSESLKIAVELHRAGISAEIYLEPPKKLAKQFAYADKKKIPFVVIAGPDEVSRGEVTIKDLSSGAQNTIKRDSLTKVMIS